MLLYVIRHGDPIYDPDSLTPKGYLQAQALAKRLAVHGLDRIYTSPLIRAQQTARPTCELLGIKPVVQEWTSEALAFEDLSITEPDGSTHWAFEGSNLRMRNDDTVKVNDEWYKIPEIARANNAEKGYKRIQDASDKFLAELGYLRQGAVYKITDPTDERVAVFCHEGFGLTWMSQLLNIPPQLFWAGFSLTHSGICVFEFKNNSDGFTAPQCLCFSDTSHIYREGLPMKHKNTIDL